MSTENRVSTGALSTNDILLWIFLSLPSGIVFDEGDLGAFVEQEVENLPQFGSLLGMRKGQCGDELDGIDRHLFFNGLLIEADSGYRVGGESLRAAHWKILEVGQEFEPEARAMARRFQALINSRRENRKA